MHLSPISDVYGDAQQVLHAGDRAASGRAHLDAVLSGALFAIALVTPFGLAAATAALDCGKSPRSPSSTPEAVSISHLRVHERH